MLGDQSVHLGQHVGVAAERKLRVDQLLDRADAQLAEPCDLALGERLISEVTERGPTPHRQRTLERRGRPLGAARRQLRPSLCYQPLEAMHVQPLRIELELVTVVARDQQAIGTVAVGERLAQSGDVDLECLGGRRRRSSAPQLLDQPIGAQRLVRVQQEQREQRLLLAAADRDDTAFVDDFERSENVKVHPGRPSDTASGQ